MHANNSNRRERLLRAVKWNLSVSAFKAHNLKIASGSVGAAAPFCPQCGNKVRSCTSYSKFGHIDLPKHDHILRFSTENSLKLKTRTDCFAESASIFSGLNTEV